MTISLVPATPKSARTTREKLEALANALLDDALSPDSEMPTKEKVEIFKPVAIWYLGVRKAKKGEPDDESKGETFESLRERINGGKGLSE